jgi:hypothetical protein
LRERASACSLCGVVRRTGPKGARLATSATVHCLLVCGLDEIGGDALGTGLNLSNAATIGLGLLFGLVGGFGPGVLPWFNRGLSLTHAARRVLVTEGLGIAVMETAEALSELLTRPNGCDAQPTVLLVWHRWCTGCRVCCCVARQPCRGTAKSDARSH